MAETPMSVDPTPEDIAYLAGFFDGEGTVGIYEYQNVGNSGLRCRARITNTCLPVLWHLQARFGGRIDSAKTPPGCKPLFHLVFDGKSIEFLLEIMLPYLIVKKEVATACLQFYATLMPGGGRAIPSQVAERRVALRDKVSQLNKRGVG